MVNLVKNSPFIRNLIYGLIQYLKNMKKHPKKYENGKIDAILISQFNSMVDLMNYLNYKDYDYEFLFNFLEESRFILNH